MFRNLLVISILVVTYSNQNFAQKTIQLAGGYGFWETAHFGMKLQIADNHLYGLLIGNNLFPLKRKETDFTFTIEHNWLLKAKSNEIGNTKWLLVNKILFIRMEDDYYGWKILTLNPNLGRYFFFTQKAGILIDVGPAFPIVLNYKRKTFEQVGWVYHISGNIRIQFIYNL